MKRAVVFLLAVSTLTLTPRATATVDTAWAGAEITRKIYVSATDAKGAPVTDLTAADLTVKEGGKDRPVASLELAKAQMQIAILVDDQGTGAFQGPVAQVLEKTFGRAQFTISMFSPKVTRIVEASEDQTALKNALAQLARRARLPMDGDQLPDAILDAAKTMQQRKAERPVILALTIAGAEPQMVDPNNVLGALRASGAQLHVVIGTGGNLGQIMADGPKQSGGRIETAAVAGLAAATASIAETLRNQYLLTYVLPDGVKMADKLAVTTSRKGITLTAPTRIPDK